MTTTPAHDIQHAHEPYPSYFRPNEVVLLMEATDESALVDKMPDSAAPLSSWLTPLPELLRGQFGVTLDRERPFMGTAAQRPPVVLRGGGDRPRVLVTANLAGWISLEEYVTHAQQPLTLKESDRWHEEGIVNVIRAVTNFERQIEAAERRPADRLWPVAISPNWLALSFCG